MAFEVWTSKEDRAFCRKCIYTTESSAQRARLLCEYYMKTGKRRGCKAGKGCDKRVIRGES